MRTIQAYLKCTSKNVLLHSKLQEMEPKCNVKWHCKQIGQQMTCMQEGHSIEVDVENRRLSDSLNLKFHDSVDQKTGKFSALPLGLPDGPQFLAPQETLSETETSVSENKGLPFENQRSSKADCAISAVAANDVHLSDWEDKAVPPTCKTFSRSKFYVYSSDENSVSTGEQFSYLSQGRRWMPNKGAHQKATNTNKHEDPQHLFHCLLLIGLNVGPNTTKVPHTLIKYPSNANVPPYTEYLCFPDALRWKPSSYEQSYSFVLTSETGQRKFGYCRRVLPEGSSACLPLAYCILTPFRARGFYYNILKELESRHGQQDKLLLAFIGTLYNSSFPKPGQTLQLVPRGSSVEEAFDETLPILRRPHDLRLEEQDLVEMFDILEISTFLKVFGSALLERKIIFISSSFSKLSSCAEALQSSLYPFSWQHVLISVLPHSLLDICQSPTPYVVGILDDDSNHVLESLHSFQEGIVVNLDESKVLRSVGDESNILPGVSVKHLRTSLELVFSAGETGESSTRNVLISEAFLHMFADLCGHYRHHILSINGEVVFDRESFIKNASSTSVRLFLEWFIETAMFSAFIDSRMQNEYEADRFDQRTFERAEEQRKQNQAGRKKSKNLKEKFKYWTGNR